MDTENLSRSAFCKIQLTKGADGRWTATASIDGETVAADRALTMEVAARGAKTAALLYLAQLPTRLPLPPAVDALFSTEIL